MTPAKKASKKTAKSVVAPRSDRVSRRPSRRMIERSINRYMDEAHCTLFSRAFDISPAGDRDTAVAWFADFFQEIDRRVR